MDVFRLDSAEIKKDAFKLMPSGALRLNVTLTRSGIFLYKDSLGNAVRELRHPSEIFNQDSIDTIKGMVFTDDHPPDMITRDNWKQFSIGSFGDNVTVRDNKYIDTTITVYDTKAIEKITTGQKVELSAGYWADTNKESGTFEGEQYDSIQKNIRYNHGSLVDKGRAGANVRIKFDSQEIDGTFLDKLEEKEIKKKMACIKIDNVDFEVTDQLQPVLGLKLDALAQTSKELDALKGKLDALELESKKWKEEQAKKDMQDFVNLVKPFLGSDVKVDGLGVRELQELVIKNDNEGITFDGKSDDYVKGIFQYVMDKPKKLDSSNSYASLKSELSNSDTRKESKLDSIFSQLGGKN